jgi:hypothetical protein
VHRDPLEWGRDVLHSVPQDPQLFMSESRSTHWSLHKVVPLFMHAGPHRAFTQDSPALQARPQTPQFFRSEKIFTQEPLQAISSWEQETSAVTVTKAVVTAVVAGRTHCPF